MSKEIFIAEDDMSVLDIYKHVFGAAGFTVTTAMDGEDAIVKLGSGILPALILLDIMMPKASGFEVLKFIKSQDSLRDIPVMFVTNLSAPEHVQKGLSLGAQKFLIKSENDPKQIVNIVADILGQSPASA